MSDDIGLTNRASNFVSRYGSNSTVAALATLAATYLPTMADDATKIAASTAGAVGAAAVAYLPAKVAGIKQKHAMTALDHLEQQGFKAHTRTVRE